MGGLQRERQGNPVPDPPPPWTEVNVRAMRASIDAILPVEPQYENIGLHIDN